MRIKVRANNSAPGVDQQILETIENEIGVEPFLEEIRESIILPMKLAFVEFASTFNKRG